MVTQSLVHEPGVVGEAEEPTNRAHPLAFNDPPCAKPGEHRMSSD